MSDLTAATSRHTELSDSNLDLLVAKLGVARFAGRIHSGLIDPAEGYAAIQRYVAKHREVLRVLGSVSDFLDSKVLRK